MDTMDTPRPVSDPHSDVAANGPEAQTESPKKPADGSSGAGTQDIFDNRFRLFMDTFSEVCEQESVPVAIAIVCDPKIQRGPLIFMRGDDYETARVLAKLLRHLKDKIAQELDA